MLTYKKVNNICFPLHLLSKDDLTQNLPKIVEQSRMILMDKVHSLHPTIFRGNPRCLITAIQYVTDFEIIFFLLEKIDQQDLEDLQILHNICEKNDKELIDTFVMKIEKDQFDRLNTIKDQDGRSPYELLNEKNKYIFEKVFS